MKIGSGRWFLGRTPFDRRALGAVVALVALVAIACNTAELRSPAPSASTGPEGTPVEEDGGVAQAPDGGEPAAEGGLPPSSSAVTIQVQPSDDAAALLSAIRSAKKSVHMTMYLLTNYEAIDALGDLKQAGKDVKVVLNQKFPTGTNDNETAYDKLKTRGVDVVWAPASHEFTHAKTIVIDGDKAIIMTMNFTQSSAATNREYIATDTDPADVADIEKLFDADYKNQPAAVTGKLVLSPSAASPIDARARLKAFIASAKTSLDVEVQSLSDDALVDAIIVAHQAKVAVRVVIDADPNVTPGEDEAIVKLKQASVPLKKLGNPDIHAKAIVVDGARVFVGLQNLTPTALLYNREIGVITDAQGEAAKVGQMIAKDFAAGATP